MVKAAKLSFSNKTRPKVKKGDQKGRVLNAKLLYPEVYQNMVDRKPYTKHGHGLNSVMSKL